MLLEPSCDFEEASEPHLKEMKQYVNIASLQEALFFLFKYS